MHAVPRGRPARRRPRRIGLVAIGLGLAVATSVAAGFGVADAAPGAPGDIASVAFPTGGIAFPTPTGSPTPLPGPGSTAERAVFALLNDQRSDHGLPPMAWSAQLAQAALTHNRAMAAAGTLSHQLPGEPDLGARISATGYRWQAAAENIGWTSQTNDAGAVRIQQMFYDEVPPDDGHRRNILSTTTTQVGISVLVDGRGKLWVTEDFGRPR